MLVGRVLRQFSAEMRGFPDNPAFLSGGRLQQMIYDLAPGR